MKIAVSSKGVNLTNDIDPRFGRASCFIIYDTDNDSFEIINNDETANVSQGVGIQTVETIAKLNVDLVIAGNFGPQAFRALEAANIKAAIRTEGTVADAIELARNNKLKLCEKASVKGHW